ncbi:MAG TPA: hypothetical protein VL688_07620 [Verrucomicrobiae bacterium]|jgi:peptidoglycan hydrolase CwlO-like protein|nr:hypothetical protein [Verrucomicrobiae bacterium]
MKTLAAFLAIFALAPAHCGRMTTHDQLHHIQDEIMQLQTQVAAVQQQLEPTLAARQAACAHGQEQSAPCILKNNELDQLQAEIKKLQAGVTEERARLQPLVDKLPKP